MTVGELLTSFPWIAPVFVYNPCVVNDGGKLYDKSSWDGTFLADAPEIPGDIAKRDINYCAVLTPTEEDRPSLLIYTK